MRKKLSALFFITFLFAIPSLAQTDSASPERAPAQSRGAKTMNFRFSPISALVGIVDANFDFLLGPNITLGPKLTYMNFKLFDVQLKGSALGAEGRYHFSGAMTDGGYANVQLSAINIEASAKSNTTGETATATGSGLNYGVGIGYHWFWDSFNLNLGLVLGGTSSGKIEVKDSTGSTVESASPNLATGLDFKIGFTF